MAGGDAAAAAWLATPAAVRVRCHALLDLAREERLAYFRLEEARLPALARFVADVIRERYPDLRVPYHSRWRHFDAGGVERLAGLRARLAGLDSAERARVRVDLAVISVLLDAGAGPAWRYLDRVTGTTLTRSEGLAVASLRLFESGALSGDPDAPLRADADALCALTPAVLGSALQTHADNPLAGLEGRVGLLNRLGEALHAAPVLFGTPPRVGRLFDTLAGRARGGRLPATAVLAALIEGLGGIWPGRLMLAGRNLGDVWPHPQAAGDGPGAGLVPFHKLSQWLAYSLVEPLEEAGIEVADPDALTGLAEYRNGGLFVDGGVLVPRDPATLTRTHTPDAVPVVEWRALTLALLDEIASLVRGRLGVDAAAFPLACVLEGGTWTAGRRLAAEHRADGGPPLHVYSDGTVF